MSKPIEARLRAVQIRTTAVTMATVIVLLAGGAIGLVRYFEQQQVQQIDQRLAASARMLSPTAAATRPTSMPGQAAAEALVQVVTPDGHVGYASDRLRGQPAMGSPGTDGTTTAPAGATVDGVGNVRVVAIPFGENWVLLAESLQGVTDAVTGLRTALFTGVPLLAAILGVVVWLVVGWTLRPVRDAMEREQRLVADVSHELRTPLAGARALLESESTIPDEVELNRLEALAVLTRLETMASDLLTQARNDQPRPMRLDRLVDLDEIALRTAALVPCPPGVTVDTSAVSGGQARGNEPDLERMISNLLANAVRHARTAVQITVAESDGAVTMTVADDGPGIASGDHARIFERFTRGDDARSRDHAGAGLGLPIVRSVAAAHGGAVHVERANMGGAMFVVTLPAAVESLTAR